MPVRRVRPRYELTPENREESRFQEHLLKILGLGCREILLVLMNLVLGLLEEIGKATLNLAITFFAPKELPSPSAMHKLSGNRTCE